MTRQAYCPVPVALVAPRHTLLQLRTWAVFATTAGMIMNEWLGPGFLALALLLWGLYGAQHASAVARALGSVGIIPWLLPLLAFVSLLWSPVPLVTARGAVQFALTIALAVLTARAVPLRHFVMGAWILSGILLALSLAFNKPAYDAMTGNVNMGGVFGNKNSLAFCCMIFALTSATIFFDRARTPLFRMLNFFGILIGLGVCIVSRSVGIAAVTSLGLGVITVLALLDLLPRRMRHSAVEIIFIIGLLVSVPLVLGITAFQEELLTAVGKDSTLTGRTLLWYYAAKISPDHPILGTGYQGFWVQGLPAAEFLWNKLHVASRTGFHFHSLYYETLINLGYVGVALGLLLIARVVLAALHWTRQSPDFSSGFCLAFILMMLVFQVQTIGLFTQFDPSSYVFFTCAAYAIGWCRQETAVLQHLRLPSRRLITGHRVRPA